jgi:arabinogalactan oligomer / maltooligosaccharide transport system permease protein
MATITAPERPRVGFRPFARSKAAGRPMPLSRQILYQLLCLFIAFTVLFPVLWILSLSLDCRGLSRPDGLNLIPACVTLDGYASVLERPTSNPISFLELARNSFFVAASTALLSVGIGVSAAYAFSRLDFRGRAPLMIAILGVLMLPAVATIAPLFVLLTRIQIGDFTLGRSLAGVMVAVVSGALPFAIWNLKGYLDTIPKELEEAAAVDGATRNQSFLRVILPLAVPALAVTGFLGFIAGWTEYYFTVIFISDAEQYTLALALNGMVGQFATQTPWSAFSAFAIMFALPVSIVYLFLQKYIIGGLAVGGVKG